MKKLTYSIWCILMILCILSVTTHASISFPAFMWKAYDSEHFILFYYEGYESLAQETLYYLEQNVSRIEKLTGNERDFKIRIVLQDVGLDSNGFAQPWNNKITLFTNNPLPDSSLASYDNWLRIVSGHELTHIKHMNNYSKFGAILPKIFGNIFSGNNFVPLWEIEGIAVYSESSVSKYEGRLNDGYFDAIIAAKAKADKLPNILEANYQHDHYPTGQWYLYGGVFLRYLAETYGEDKLTQFFEIHGQHPFGILGALSPDIGIDIAAKKVFGKPLNHLYDEWQEAEKKEHQDWIIDGEQITYLDKGYISYLNSYNNKLYYVQLQTISPSPDTTEGLTKLVEYDPNTRTQRYLAAIPSVLGNIHIWNNRIYYLTPENAWGYANVDDLAFGSTGLLKYYDLNSGATVKLFQDEAKAFTVLDSGEIIYSKNKKGKFGSEIWKYRNGEKVQLGEIEQIIAEIDIHGDNIIIVSRPQVGSWNINSLTLSDLSIEPLLNTPWNESSIFIDNTDLYYTANYNHEYGIYKYSFTTGSVTRLTQGGYAHNGVPVNDQLYFKAITADGDGIFKKIITPIPYALTRSEIEQKKPIAEFAQSLREISAFETNLSYIFKPAGRFIPTFLTGEDGLNLFAYSVDYSDYWDFDFAFQTKLFMPLEMSLSNYVVDETGRRITDIAIGYPVYLSRQYGLRSVYLTGSTNFTTHSGTITAGFGFPRQNITFSIFGNQDGGLNGNLSYRYKFNDSNLQLEGTVFNKLNRSIMTRSPLPINTDQNLGVAFSADYTHRLLEVNKGFWNSTLFVSDLYGTLFTESTSLDPLLTTVGGELKLELGMGWAVITAPTLTFGVNLNGDYRTDFTIELY